MGQRQPFPPRLPGRHRRRSGPSRPHGGSTSARLANAFAEPVGDQGNPTAPSMIAKITQGARRARALIRYLFGPGRANEHSEQRVVASGIVLGGDAKRGDRLTPPRSPISVRRLDAANDLYGTDPAGWTHLASLAVAPCRGSQLSDEQWAEIAQRAIEAVGLRRRRRRNQRPGWPSGTEQRPGQPAHPPRGVAGPGRRQPGEHLAVQADPVPLCAEIERTTA